MKVLVLSSLYRTTPVEGAGSIENFVHLLSNTLLSKHPCEIKVLADLMLPSSGNTITTQIDFVVVSNYGIFCIEVKGTEGWVYGNAYDKSWTQVYFKYHQKLFNPLRQNFAHKKALETLLGQQYLKAPVIPLVIFTYADKINVTETESVGNLTDSINKVKNYKQPIYTDIERDAIYDMLAKTNITDKELRKTHDKAVGKLKRLNTR